MKKYLAYVGAKISTDSNKKWFRLFLDRLGINIKFVIMHSIALLGVLFWVMIILLFLFSLIPGTRDVTVQSFPEFMEKILMIGVFFIIMTTLLMMAEPNHRHCSPFVRKTSLFTIGWISSDTPFKTMLFLNPIFLPFFLSWKMISLIWGIKEV